VTGDDYARLGDDDAQTLVEWLENEAFMKLTRTRGVSHCAALDVRRDGYFCRVYERRPQVCRDLERGSGACAGERHAKGPRLVVLHSKE
jgi:Fe-S-cluster containining protein